MQMLLTQLDLPIKIWFRSILAETSRTVEFFYPKYYNKFSDGRPEGGGSDGCPEGGGNGV